MDPSTRAKFLFAHTRIQASALRRSLIQHLLHTHNVDDAFISVSPFRDKETGSRGLQSSAAGVCVGAGAALRRHFDTENEVLRQSDTVPVADKTRNNRGLVSSDPNTSHTTASLPFPARLFAVCDAPAICSNLQHYQSRGFLPGDRSAPIKRKIRLIIRASILGSEQAAAVRASAASESCC